MPNDRSEQLHGPPPSQQTAGQIRVSVIVFAGFHEYDKKYADRLSLAAITTAAVWESPQMYVPASVYITTHGVAGRVALKLTYGGPGRDVSLIAQYSFAHDSPVIDVTCQQIIRDSFAIVGYGTYWFRVVHEGKEIAELPVIFSPLPNRLTE